jgi:DNA replication protein DnaC
MLNHTMDQIAGLKLHGLQTALNEQMDQPGNYSNLSFEERLAHLVDREVTERRNQKIKRLLGLSRLKYKQAYVEDIEYHERRNLHRSQVQSLLQNQWINQKQNVIITGPTGTGKTWLACALAVNAITSEYSASYMRIAHLLSEIMLVRAEGSYLKWLKKISRYSLVILDDLGLSSLTISQAQELLEVIEERQGSGSCIITSQLPVKEWYSYFKNPTVADAIMDRLVHNAYRINLQGDSMRKVKNKVVAQNEPKVD